MKNRKLKENLSPEFADLLRDMIYSIEALDEYGDIENLFSSSLWKKAWDAKERAEEILDENGLKEKKLLKESVADVVNSFIKIEKKLKKHFPNYEINWATDDDGDFFVIANKDPFFYYVFDIDLGMMKVTMFDGNGESIGSDYIKYIDDLYGAIIGLINPYIREFD